MTLRRPVGLDRVRRCCHNGRQVPPQGRHCCRYGVGIVSTLAGKTYEIQVDHGDGRWVMVDVLETRSAALTQAEELSETVQYAAVRVMAESPRAGVEIIFENVTEGFDDRAITIVMIDQAPFCQTADAYYDFPARVVAGRVLRNYLEAHGCSVLELMYDAGRLRMLENDASLFPQAVQQIAGAQARGTDVRPSQRRDELYEAFADIRERAVRVAPDRLGYDLLTADGLNALVDELTEHHGSKKSVFYIRHALACYLRQGGDWDAKIAHLLNLAKVDLHPAATGFLDESIAEILSGLPAVRELLAGQPDAAEANRVLIHLSEGRVRGAPVVRSCLDDLNGVMGRMALPLTRQMLLAHVADYLRGVRPLTREGADADRQAFVVLVRELVDVAGLRGGHRMCEAVTRRARIAFAGLDDNLSFEDAMARILNIVPHRAARLGYLVELALSNISREQKSHVLAAISRTVQQLTSLASLVPTGSKPDIMRKAIDGLKFRLTSNDIPAEWRESLRNTFDILMKKPTSDLAKSAPVNEIISDEEFNAMLTEKPGQKEAEVGDILFEEGDVGEEAYLILEGEIEIFQRVGNAENVIARLGKGEIIGEMSLIDQQPRMASARVLENARLTVITRKSLTMRLRRLEQDDRVMRRLLDVLVNRLRGDAQAGV